MRFDTLLGRINRRLDSGMASERRARLHLSEAAPAPAAPTVDARSPYPGPNKVVKNKEPVRGPSPNGFTMIRDGTFQNTLQEGQPIVMWFLKGMRTCTTAIRSTMTNDVSAISGMHPKCGKHLLAILKGEAVLVPRCLVTEDEGTVELGSLRKVAKTDEHGNVVMKKDGTGPDETFVWDENSGFTDDPGGVGQAVLDPKCTLKDLDTPQNGATDKYKRKQYFQSMYWLVCTASMEEGRGVLNGDEVVSKMYEADKKAFQKYWEELAQNEQLWEWLAEEDESVTHRTERTNVFGNQLQGDEDDAYDYGSAANGSTSELGGFTEEVEPPEPEEPEDPGEPYDPEVTDDFSRRIYEIGQQYESVVQKEWFKNQALLFVKQLRNKYVDGLPQLIGGNYGVTYTDFFTTTGDRNLWYGINHYPPAKTQWTNRPMLRRTLYATDKQRTMTRRVKAVRDMFNVDMVRHPAGGGQATVKTL